MTAMADQRETVPVEAEIPRVSVAFRSLIISLILILLAYTDAVSQSSETEPVINNDFETRTELSLDAKILPGLKLHMNPELRFRDDFSLDDYLIEAGIKYRPMNFLQLGASYRFIGNRRISNATEYLNRYAFDIELERKIARFEAGFTLRYTDYPDDESEGQYLRYKPELKYDIPGCRITPVLAVQAFHELSLNKIAKIRYEAGLEYKLMKHNYIGLSYKFDYYRLEYRNRHILGIRYRYKF